MNLSYGRCLTCSSTSIAFAVTVCHTLHLTQHTILHSLRSFCCCRRRCASQLHSHTNCAKEEGAKRHTATPKNCRHHLTPEGDQHKGVRAAPPPNTHLAKQAGDSLMPQQSR